MSNSEKNRLPLNPLRHLGISVLLMFSCIVVQFQVLGGFQIWFLGWSWVLRPLVLNFDQNKSDPASKEDLGLTLLEGVISSLKISLGFPWNCFNFTMSFSDWGLIATDIMNSPIMK